MPSQGERPVFATIRQQTTSQSNHIATLAQIHHPISPISGNFKSFTAPKDDLRTEKFPPNRNGFHVANRDGRP